MFDARNFIERLKAENIHLSTDGTTIKVWGDKAQIAVRLDAIRQHKPAIIWQLRHMAVREVCA